MLSSYDIRVCMKPHCTLRQIFIHPKDPIPMDQRSGVVYEIPCDDCEQVYVGQTDRSFACRLKEHRRAFKSIDDMRSAVAEHSFNSGHAINWDNARVIDTCHHYYTRIFLESWYISSKRHAMNKDRGPSRVFIELCICSWIRQLFATTCRLCQTSILYHTCTVHLETVF